MRSNSGIPAGTRRAPSACCRTRTSRFVSPTTLMRRRHGSARRISFTSAAMALGGRYKGRYAQAALGSWARKIKQWRGRGYNVYVFFDNDQKSAAPLDAKRLLEVLK